MFFPAVPLVSDIKFLFTLCCCCCADLGVASCCCCCDAGDLICGVVDDPGNLFGVDVCTMLTTDVFLLVHPINIKIIK